MTSPLLQLPTEIRLQIYEYVLCGKTIHIAARKDLSGTDGSFSNRPHEPRIDLIHATCTCPRDWQEKYKMSKTSDAAIRSNFDERGFLKWSKVNQPEVLRSHHTDHEHCYSTLNDFAWQDYATFEDRECRCSVPCGHYFEYRARMVKQFGQAPAGLRLKHRASRFDTALLRTCRSVYNECSLLPYKGNTFAFQACADVDIFLGAHLNTMQRNSIRRLNVCMQSLKDPTLPRIIPENLQVLECFLIGDNEDCLSGIERWEGKFNSVQVISGWDGRRSVFRDGRMLRRERAAILETRLERCDC